MTRPGSKDRCDPSAVERADAARAHLSAWLGVVPFLGMVPAAAIFVRRAGRSPWTAQQALQAVLFQLLAVNALIVVLAVVLPVAYVAWNGSREGGALAGAMVLTALPFAVVHYAAQGLLASRAARAVRRGECYRYVLVGRLLGAPAAVAAAAGPDGAQSRSGVGAS